MLTKGQERCEKKQQQKNVSTKGNQFSWKIIT